VTQVAQALGLGSRYTIRWGINR